MNPHARPRGLCGALVVGALGFVAVHTPTAQTKDQRREWNQPVPPFRIVGNIHYVGAAGVSAFLIESGEGLMLLDGGLPETAAQIAQGIAALGFRVRDVEYLLNSHAHYDHAGGLAELKRRSGGAVVAAAGDAPALRAGGPDMPPVAVDRIVSDGEAVRLGEVSLTANVTPGHTKGCTTWTTTATEGDRRLAVTFHCSTSVVDRLVGNTAYPEIVGDYERTFARLRGLASDVFLAPHPGFFRMEEKRARMATGGPNPFVDQTELGRFVDASERQFRSALAKERSTR
jgi:metallo-beta-lactamase class B